MTIGIEFSESQEREYTEMAKSRMEGMEPGKIWHLAYARNRGRGIISIWILNVTPGKHYRFFKNQEEALVAKVLLA